MAVEIDYTANSPVNLYNTHPLFQCPNLLNHPNLFVILDLIVLLKGASCC